MSKVGLVKSNDSYKGTLKALEFLKKDIQQAMKGKSRPIIKVNFVSVYRQLAATPLSTVKAILDFLQPIYQESKIKIVEGATIGETSQGWDNYGYSDLANEYNVELVDLNEDKAEMVEIFDSQGKPMKLPFAKTILDSDFVISACRAKTHDTVVATLGLKNLLVGGLHDRSKIHQGKWINYSLAKLAEKVNPDLTVIDGVIGMQGDGPVNGKLIDSNWVAAGLDWLAVDSVAAKLMGFKLNDIGYLKLAEEAGLGKTKPEVVGEKPEKLQRQFEPHATFEEQRRWQIKK